ncbi:hypothetical protein [Aminobacter ciceronei]|uniref:Abortive infection protein-like C-terminal domain-containing protein n=1 Tax=Aminobacter ciceronei TaxID=150723 RepID=A0ABR6CGK0_9HYPH|nr:hypothetical protein [Aminobacter ciceronei]MBA8909913.1 hypothetical protein [Aminobacter ciceronei]MBA9023685.1 hypothetical protein [Aminobacter ciceronei]
MNFNGQWRFDSPGKIPDGVNREFNTLVGKIASQGNSRQAILEHFKRYFAGVIGATSSTSSSESWAESDLDRYMSHAADNAPLFIEAFFDGCEGLAHSGFVVPDVGRMNRILAENNAGYEIRPPDLVVIGLHQPIPVPERYVSLDERAQETIRESFKNSEQLLAEGRPRQAVQEILWLMESVATAFRGLSAGDTTIEGKYFNKIADALRKHHKGTTFEQVLNWLTTLHGYLSSPTGGGIRHGRDLKEGIEIGPSEGRLYCNLIRTYVTFLIAEHERLSTAETTRFLA